MSLSRSRFIGHIDFHGRNSPSGEGASSSAPSSLLAAARGRGAAARCGEAAFGAAWVGLGAADATDPASCGPAGSSLWGEGGAVGATDPATCGLEGSDLGAEGGATAPGG
ncbi:MAG: hypothetical protein ACRELB_21760, partial [Polyangiaceae bacterium]